MPQPPRRRRPRRRTASSRSSPSAPARPEIHRAIGALQQIADGFALRRRQLAAEVGITEAQWRLLEEVAGDDFMPSLFARRRECTPAAVSRGLRSLLDAGWVEVEVAAQDGRQRVYRLTPTGRALLRRLRGGREAAIANVWEHLPAGELARFADFAEYLASALHAYAATQTRNRKSD